MADSLLNFSNEVQENVQELLSETGTPIQAFTKYVIDEISEKSNLGESELCYAAIRSSSGAVQGEINAYSISFNGETVSLFYTIYKSGYSGIEYVKAEEYKNAVSKLQGFYLSAVKGFYKNLEPSSDHYTLCKYLYDKQSDICNVRLFVISNGIIGNALKEPKKRILNKHLDFPIWDLNKLYINSNSQSDHESIDIDLISDPEFQFDLPCLSTVSDVENYQCLMVLVPGKFLYNLYENFNTNLLQNNVRFFLGFKGKKSVNKDILNTLRKLPQRFLAYNNGITATAQDIIVEDKKIVMIQDFQILNGGQTTASIYFGKQLERKDAPETYIDLSKVYVQMKLIVLRENVREIISDITIYSNSQKQIKIADYSTNNTFNLKLQELSRTLYTPDIHGNGDLTQWYFERVRGQYEADLRNCATPAAKKYFQTVHPPKQRFRKELLAKVWQGWNQYPYYVCLGDQGNYNRFIRDVEDNELDPDIIYFEDTVALLLIYNYMQKDSSIFKDFHQLKANLIGYTMAALNCITDGQLSLYKIWLAQEISDSLKAFIDSLAQSVYDRMIKDCPHNVTFRDFAKSKNTWDVVKKYSHNLDFKLLEGAYKSTNEDAERKNSLVASVDEENYRRIISYGSKFWSGLASDKVDFLDTHEKNDAMDIAERITREQILTEKQIPAAEAIIEKFNATQYSIDDIKGLSSLIADKTDNGLFSVYQRIMKLSDSDWSSVAIMAGRICDSKHAKSVTRVSKMADKKKAKASDLAMINEVLDQINAKFGKDF